MSFIGIDQGTSSTKALRFESPGFVVAAQRVPVTRSSPARGLVEQSPQELLASVQQALRRLLPCPASPVRACGLANQGESFLLYDKITGEPVTPVICWMDSRSQDEVGQLRRDGHAAEIKQRSGLELQTQFPATKLRRLLRLPAAQALLKGGRLGFATLDTWLVNRLCAEHEHITDWSTASRTMLFNVDEGDWDSALCDLFAVPMDILPEVRASDNVRGTILIDGHELPLLAGILDTSAGLFGSACLDVGEAKSGFGTCASLWVNAGARRPHTANLDDAIAWNRSGSVCYAVEAETPAGAVLTWACDQLGLAGSAAELVALAAAGKDEGRVMLVPAFAGLGAPYWGTSPGAALFGIGYDTTKADIARACLDAISFSLADAMEAVRDGGSDVTELRVDGGLSESRLLMQRCADATGIPLVVGSMREATCFGAGALGALAAGEIDGLDSVRTVWAPAERFDPFWTDETRVQRRGAWRETVAAVRGIRMP